MNVAVGLGRLDVPATLLTQVGHDERGGMIVSHVTGSDAEIVATEPASGHTSVAVARVDAAGLARYEFDITWSLEPTPLPSCSALHVGSLGTVLEPGREAVRDLVDQAADADLFVSYDPNLRDGFVGDRDEAWRDVRSLGARCTLVKLSDEDAELLRPGTDPDDLARTLLEGERTRLVILTRGGEGATAFAGEHEVSARPRSIDPVDTVGAGDAFMAATLAQLSDLDAFAVGLPTSPEALTTLLAGSVEVAALTCERRGANPPRRRDLPTGWPG